MRVQSTWEGRKMLQSLAKESRMDWKGEEHWTRLLPGNCISTFIAEEEAGRHAMQEASSK
jgi:hypothetical protein